MFFLGFFSFFFVWQFGAWNSAPEDRSPGNTSHGMESGAILTTHLAKSNVRLAVGEIILCVVAVQQATGRRPLICVAGAKTVAQR